MNSFFEAIKVVCLVILTVLVVYIAISEIKAVKADVGLLKTEMKSLRIYLTAFPSPGQCAPPGMERTSRICPYDVIITGITSTEKGKNLYRGIIDPAVYKTSSEACKAMLKTVRDEFKPVMPACREPNDYPGSTNSYAFEVDGQKLEVRDSPYHLVNVPGTTHLMMPPTWEEKKSS
jgi:hypothetical protein